MRTRQILGNLFKLAMLCVCFYAVIEWRGAESQDSTLEEFAENACVDEIRNRYNLSSLGAYDVAETGTGYTVRVSATSSRGTRVKVVCLTNDHGGVRDIEIDER